MYIFLSSIKKYDTHPSHLSNHPDISLSHIIRDVEDHFFISKQLKLNPKLDVTRKK